MKQLSYSQDIPCMSFWKSIVAGITSEKPLNWRDIYLWSKIWYKGHILTIQEDGVEEQFRSAETVYDFTAKYLQSAMKKD